MAFLFLGALALGMVLCTLGMLRCHWLTIHPGAGFILLAGYCLLATLVFTYCRTTPQPLIPKESGR